MSDVWGSFWQGARIGEHYGETRRNRDAYRDGGMDAVEQAAGNAGDLEGVEQVRTMQRAQRRFEDDERQQAYERMNTIAPWARNVIRATRNMDPQRADAFLQQNEQRFLDFGFTPDQVAAARRGLSSADPNERAQWQQELDSAFTQHENPDWQLVGSTYVAPTPEGQPLIGGTLPEDVNTYEWRRLTPEDGYDLPPGVIGQINREGQVRTIVGRPPQGRSGGASDQYARPEDNPDFAGWADGQ